MGKKFVSTSSLFATTERKKGYPVSFGGMVQNSFHPTAVVFTTVVRKEIHRFFHEKVSEKLKYFFVLNYEKYSEFFFLCILEYKRADSLKRVNILLKKLVNLFQECCWMANQKGPK